DKSKPPELLDHAIRQIVSNALVSDEIVDIFAAAGLKKPDISILSDEFLAEIRGMPHRNLAVELLRKLLVGEIKTRSQRNVVQARSFTELLERSIRRYQNRAVETAQGMEELIGLAKDMRAANARGEELGLSEDELAFYDALETNDSAVKVLGEPTLKTIARELVATVRKNVTIDWTLRQNVRAQLRVLVKRILRKYGYPPDKQEKATQTVLEQAPSEEGDALGFEAFLAVDHFDPDPLAGIEGVDAAAAQRGDVDEHILAATVRRNKAVTLFGLEPFHRAFHGLGRPGAAAVDAAASALRRHRGAVVDIQDGRHQRALRPGAALAVA